MHCGVFKVLEVIRLKSVRTVFNKRFFKKSQAGKTQFYKKIISDDKATKVNM